MQFSSRSHRKQLFSMKLTRNPPTASRLNNKETKRKRITSRNDIVTAGGCALVSQAKITYGDFLIRFSIVFQLK